MFDEGERVYKKGDPPRYLAIPIDGGVDEFPQGQIACEEFLNLQTGQIIDKDYLKKGKGLVAILKFDVITRLTNKNTSELMKQVPDSY